MSCMCRSLSWIVFVRSLAQVHRLESTAVRRSPAPTVGQTTTVYGRLLGVARQWRHLHVSAVSRQGAAGAAAALVQEEAPRGLRAATPPGSAARPAVSETPECQAQWQRRDGAKNGPDAEAKATLKRRKSQRCEADADESDRASSATPRRKLDGWKTQKLAVKGKFPDRPQQKPQRCEAGVDESDRTSSATPRRKLDGWKTQKLALKEKFPEGWNPRKKLSPDALAGVQALNAQFPDVYTTEVLAKKFAVSPEAIRRILKSRWKPSPEEEEARQARWFRRGMRVWEQKAALGIKPPKRWRMEGITRDPSYHERRKWAMEREKRIQEMEIEKYKAARPWIKWENKGNSG